MLSVFDKLFLKEYSLKDYNCMHFVVDTWQDLYGVDLSFLVPNIQKNEKHVHEVISMGALKRFKRLKAPKTPSLAIMRGARPDDLHVGTYIDGRIFHLTELGVMFLDYSVAVLGFPKVQFYEYTDNHK